MLPLVIVFSSLSVGVAEVAAPLTEVTQVRRLNLEQLRNALPVKLSGVVTYAGGALGKDLFLQDNSAGIYVSPDDRLKDLKPGDAIELEGVTDPGKFSPCVRMKSFSKIGRGRPLPVPLPFTMMPEDARWMDGQYVQVWGVVSKVECRQEVTFLSVYNTHGRVVVCLPIQLKPESVAGIVNAPVTIRGVCVPSIDESERIITKDPPKIFANAFPMLPTFPVGRGAVGSIQSLLKFSPDPHPGMRRLELTGVVSGVVPDGRIYVEDSSAGLEVELEITRNDIKPGDRVKATGLVMIEGRRIGMTRGEIEVIGRGQVSHQIPIALAALESGLAFGRRVRTRGRVEQAEHRGDRTHLTLLDGTARLDVRVEGLLELPTVGSIMQADGIMGRYHPRRGSGQPLLFVGKPDELVLLESPPIPPVPPPPGWWTPQRIAAVVGGAMAVAAIAFVWVATLRRQVRQKTAELRREYDARAELEEKLRTSQKLEAIGRLAGGVAHDFNNLLTVINGCGELLAADDGLRPAQQDLARDIRSAGERAAGLVSQLLLFSRRQPVRLMPMDLTIAVRDAERMLQRVLGETIRIESRYATSLPPVKAEPTLIHQIVLNLAVNAKDAMPEGGTLSIAVEAANDRVRLSVADTGYGMDDATRAKIFEPFFTTKGVGAGTGLGLATVYGIVQTLEGEIRCHSAPGQGTTFEIDFPAAPAAAAKPDTAHRPTPQSRGGTILVCEDDDAVRDMTCCMLVAAGFEVLQAETPIEAARLAESHPETIDLLLTDVVMPELNGRELAERVKPLRPEMQVVFMTGYTDDELLRQGFAAERLEVVNKPFTVAKLTEKIREVLGRPPITSACR